MKHPRRGAKLLFKRFNGVKADGVYKGTDSTGKRGDWLRVKVNWKDEPIKIRAGQVLKIDGVAA